MEFSSFVSLTVHHNVEITEINSNFVKASAFKVVYSAVWKNVNFFRQINSMVTSLVKTLLSRNFCGKSVREDLCTCHTAQCGNYGITVWKLRKFPPTLNNFREIDL